MDGDLRRRTEELFLRAADLPAAERAAFLGRECGDDRVRAEVESLLACHDRGGAGFLETPITGGRTPRSSAPGAMPPAIGPYHILRELGAGGFGVVYLAEQREPFHRQVAVKVLKLGMDTRRVVARFASERQLLARLNHPHIARVLDAGTTADGRPYFVMEHVPGRPITQHADARQLSLPARLGLFSQVCDAVLHAHQKGVIHRDLKPSNVLVEDAGPKPLVKVIDFGIAKALEEDDGERSLLTREGELIGTPEYMSPEQAGLAEAIDTRTDIYSLGVILYEIVTGALPFAPEDLRRAGFAESLRRIREDDPPRPSTRLAALGAATEAIARERGTDARSLRRALRGDLEWIILRAMEKDPRRRYASAAGLAADLDRYLRLEPVLAGPPGAGYRLRKFAARHRVGVAAAGLVLLALVLGLAAAVAGFVQATRARNELAMKEEAAVRQAARANLAAAAALIQAHKVAQARDLLQRVPPERRGWEWNHAVWLADTSLRTLAPGEGGVLQVACLADGASIAVNLWDRSASVLDLEGRKPRRPLAGTRHSGEFFAASPDGRSLLVHGEGGIELRELASDRELWRRPGRASLHPRAFHPSGEVLVAGVAAESRAWIIDAATGREVRSFPLALSAEIPGFSPSGERIVYKSWVGYTAVEAQTGEAVWEHQARGFAWDAATLPAGGWLVAVVADDMLRVLDGDTGKLLYQRSGASSDITTVALSPRGDRLATAEFSGAVGLWEPASGELLAVLHGHAGNCSSLDFTGDGRRLVTGAHSEIKVWDAATSVSESLAARVRGQLQHHRIFNAALSPDGKRAATLGWGNISLWDAETGAELWTRVGSREYYFCGAFSRDGRRLAAADAARALTVLDVERGEPPPWTLRLPPILLVLAWTPRGELLAAGDDGAVRAIDPAAGQVIRELTRHGNPVQALAVSPDGTRIASGSGDPQLLSSGYLPPPGNGETSIRLLDGEGRELRTLRAHGAAVQCLAFSGDGTLFASGDARGRLVLWDAASGDLRAELSAAGTELRSLAFSPDGLRLAAVRSVVEDASIHLWDTRNADEAAVLRVAGNTGAALGFSASGSALLAAGQGATVIASFETGPPACGFEARERVRRARALIDRLFDEEVLSAGVVARLEADDDLDPALRATAVSLALARGDQLNYLNSEAWGTVRQAGRPPAELAEALRKAELVARLRPDDYGFLNTLGVAQYRAGRLEEAVATLRRCEEMYRERRGTAHPIDVAVLAMARRRLGKDEEARADLERMRALLGAPEHAADVETAVIAREAERLVAGGAEAEAGSEAESDSESESDAESDADADPESDPGSGSGSGSGTGTGTGKKK